MQDIVTTRQTRPRCPLANAHLGLPLALAAIGTVASLASSSRRVHIVCGGLWLGLSALHAWQYRRRLEQDVATLRQKAASLGCVARH